MAPTLIIIWVACTAMWFFHIKERTAYHNSEKMVLVKEFAMCSGGLALFLAGIWFFCQ